MGMAQAMGAHGWFLLMRLAAAALWGLECTPRRTGARICYTLTRGSTDVGACPAAMCCAAVLSAGRLIRIAAPAPRSAAP